MNLKAFEDKHLFQITVKEFINLQKTLAGNVPLPNPQPIGRKYVYGIMGIARLLGCSRSSVDRLRKKGIIEEAIIQDGRKIIVDAELALELMKKSK